MLVWNGAIEMKTALKLILAVAGLFGLGAMPAQAAVQVTAYDYVPPAVYGGLTLGANSFGGEAGRFQLTLQELPNGNSYQLYSFCIDILTSLYSYSPYDIQNGGALFTPTKQDHLAALLSHADAEISAAGDLAAQSKTAAAFQLAVWEVVYDDGPYSLSSGNFSTFGDFNALGVSTLGETFLAHVAANTWTGNAAQLRLLVSQTGQSQNQVYMNGNPAVPEPASWLMMIVGFGFIGQTLRSRRKLTEAAA
jgi:PEP-CTERM motif